eukprot:COSAG01_NODE_48201_length_383_cov_0.911972_1_plen_29_part_01
MVRSAREGAGYTHTFASCAMEYLSDTAWS